MLKEGGLGLRSVPDCSHEHLDERPQRDRERASGRATVEVRQTALLGDRAQTLRQGRSCRYPAESSRVRRIRGCAERRILMGAAEGEAEGISWMMWSPATT
jgi:hypothetical protein